MDETRLDPSLPAEEAIPRLVEAHGGRLYALGARFCGDEDQARDLVQETFLLAFRNWDRFEGRSDPATWLYTIASRVCQRFHRKRAGEPERIESLDVEPPFAAPRMGVVAAADEGPLEAHIRAEAAELVERAVAALPEAFRRPLVLKELAGFSLEEIGRILGLRQATVKTRLHRARLRVREALEQALPQREVPPAAFSRQVCLDLLQAKQDSLDREVEFRFPGEVVCERCAELFATLDLSRDLCRDLSTGELPEELRHVLLARVADESRGGPEA